jgi:hypothetical protein
MQKRARERSRKTPDIFMVSVSSLRSRLLCSAWVLCPDTSQKALKLTLRFIYRDR